MVAGITMLAVAEAFAMGERSSASIPRRSTMCLSMSTANSYVPSRGCPLPGTVPTAPSSNGFKPGFAGKLMLKDLCLSQVAAQMAGTATPLGGAATAAYAMHIANGDLDSSSIVKLLKPDVA
jgi:3-hydroxyisobutyrate dehydrogenase